VTELVYRKQIQPVLQTGAAAIDRIFGPLPGASHAGSHSEQQKGHPLILRMAVYLGFYRWA